MSAHASSDRALIVANACGPAAWGGQLLATYATVSLDCESPWHVSIAAYHAASFVAAIVALAGVAFGVIALRGGVDTARRRWMASAAVIASGTFLLGIAFGELPALVLGSCG